MFGAVRVTFPDLRVDARMRRYWLVLAAITLIVLSGAALAGFVAGPHREPAPHRACATRRRRAGAATWRRAPTRRAARGRCATRARFNDMVGRLDVLVARSAEFAADASHQLRTPLTALRLRLENLREAAGRARRDLDGALEEVERLARIIDGLLALARAEPARARA